jgi:hypothetical protein
MARPTPAVEDTTNVYTLTDADLGVDDGDERPFEPRLCVRRMAKPEQCVTHEGGTFASLRASSCDRRSRDMTSRKYAPDAAL